MKSSIMILLLCSAHLLMLLVNGGFVDITLHNNTITRTISVTYYGYIGFFSIISGADSPPVCKFSYLFEMASINITSTTCSDLNITDYGDSFECGAMGSTILECQRMGRNSSCANNKSWTVFFMNMTSLKKCAGICSVNINESINITYQENITMVPESACPRPTNSTITEIPTTLSTLSETSTPTPTHSSSATFHIITQSTEADSLSTANVALSASSSQTPLIIGLCVSNGIWASIFICVIIFCLRKRANHPSSHRTVSNKVNERKPYTAPDDYNSAYQDDNPAISNHPSQTKHSKTVKPHIKMFLYFKKHGRNRDPDGDENVTNMAQKKNKKGKEVKSKTKEIDVQTVNVQNDSSVIYINKTVCDLSRDGISLNTAGHLYDHLTIVTKDTKSEDGCYLKPTPSTLEMEREDLGRNGTHGRPNTNLPAYKPKVQGRLDVIGIVDDKVDQSFRHSNPSRLDGDYVEIE